MGRYLYCVMSLGLMKEVSVGYGGDKRCDFFF